MIGLKITIPKAYGKTIEILEEMKAKYLADPQSQTIVAEINYPEGQQLNMLANLGWIEIITSNSKKI